MSLYLTDDVIQRNLHLFGRRSHHSAQRVPRWSPW